MSCELCVDQYTADQSAKVANDIKPGSHPTQCRQCTVTYTWQWKATHCMQRIQRTDTASIVVLWPLCCLHALHVHLSAYALTGISYSYNLKYSGIHQWTAPFCMPLSTEGYSEIQLYTFVEIWLTSLETCCSFSLHQPLYSFLNDTVYIK